MSNNCVKPKFFMNMTLNVGIHVLILFCILGCLFMYYISIIESDSLNGEIIHQIHSIPMPTSMQLPLPLQGSLSSIAKDYNLNIPNSEQSSTQNTLNALAKDYNLNLPNTNINTNNNNDIYSKNPLFPIDFIKQIKQIYSKPDKLRTTYNNWLFKAIKMTMAGLFIFIVTVVVILLYDCNQCIEIKRILLENLFAFAFIGIFEVLFFTKVALKYIPAVPSVLINSFFDSIKKNL